MSNKISVIFICTLFFFVVQTISIAQVDSVKKINTTAVQTADSTTVVSGITIPAGTKLMVNISKPITTATNPAGSTFSETLEVDFVYDGKVIAPKGSTIYGRIDECRGGRVLGGSKLTFEFTGIMINNQLTAIVTEPIGVEGGKGNTAKMVGAGALIGGAFGGGSGSGTGALIAGGLAVLSSGKNHIQIPAGTLVEVPLKSPLVIK